MLSTKLLECLQDLIEINIDAYHSYSQAINALDEARIIDEFTECRTEHSNQISALNQIIKNLNGIPVRFAHEFNPASITLYSELKNLTGAKGILKSMHTIEAIAIDRYQAVLNEVLPDEIQDGLQNNLDALNRNLTYINSLLTQLSHIETA